MQDAIEYIAGNIVTIEQLQSKIKKYTQIESQEQAVLKLLMYTYELYLSDDAKINFYYNYIKNHFELSYSSVYEIRKSIQKIIEPNHRLIDSAVIEICNKLNSIDADYYLVGAVPCYLAIKTPFVRFHDDIDIVLNENYSMKIEDLFYNSEYDYIDKRYSNINYFDSASGQVRGEHELIAYHKKHKFHIGFYLFVRGDKNEFIRRYYYQSGSDNNKKIMVCDRKSSVEFTCLNYNNSPIQFKGTSFKMESLEGIYNSKNRDKGNPGREKDYYDMAMIKSSGKLNHDKAKKLQVLWENITPNNYAIDAVSTKT